MAAEPIYAPNDSGQDTPSRKPIGKRLRFEIFKRDGFACQYCGAHPPEAVLEIDHIVPVAGGGDNDPLNLITSCFKCNRGKGAVSLTNVPKSLEQQAAEVAEQEEQILGYQSILRSRRDRIEAECWEVIDRLYGEQECLKSEFVSVKRFVEQLGVVAVLDAADIALSKPLYRNRLFRYFCGICLNRMADRGEA